LLANYQPSGKPIMNSYPPTTASANAADTVNIRAFLQQAVDHYPWLAAFGFTLELPYRESIADHRSLILRFHTEVWQRIGEYMWQRQQARQNLPPTVLRWIWESASAPACKMVLLMYLDTLGTVSNPPLMDSVLHDMFAIIGDAWLMVAGTDNSVASSRLSLSVVQTGVHFPDYSASYRKE
jgi:hypothetical protein